MQSKSILANFSWLLFNKIINILAGLVASIIVVRYIGPDNNGILNYSMSFCALFSAIAAMGTENFVTKEFANDIDSSGKIAGTSATLIGIGSLFAFFTSNLCAYFFNLSDYKLYIFILSLQFLSKPLAVFQYWFISKSNSCFYSVAQSIVHIFCLIIKVFLVLSKNDFIYFVIITSLEYILLDVSMSIAYCFCKDKLTRFTFDFEELKFYFKICFPLIFSSLAITIYMKFDQIMIGQMLGNSQLGIYSVAVKLAEYWYFMPLIIFNSYLPKLSKQYSENNKSYYKNLQIFSDIQGGIGITAALGISLFSFYIIRLLYGEQYSGASEILAIYSWAGLFVSLSYVKVVHCTNCNITKFQMVSTLIGAIINLIINFITIPLIGMVGAAISTVISQFVSSIMVCFFYKDLKNIAGIQIKSLFPFKRLFTYLMNRKKRIVK